MTKRTLLIMGIMLALALSLSACGSVTNATTDQTSPTPDVTPPSDAPAGDEEVSPYTEMSAADAAIPAGNTAVVFTSDWVQGSLASVELESPFAAQPNRITTNGSDAVVRSFGGRIYVVNRFGSDSITAIDPATFKPVSKESDFSVGKKSNPQDIVVVSDEKAYVSRLDAQDADDKSDIWIVNPLTGAHLGSIDLTPWTTDDGERLSRAASMVLVDGKLYVCMQDLPAFLGTPANTNGKVAVIDTATDAVIDVDPDTSGTQVIELAGRNPSDITYSPLTKKFYVADTGVYNPFPTIDTTTAFGGIEVFSLADGRYTDEGIVVDDADLGGGVSEVRIASDALAYTITNSTTIAAFNPTTYEVVDTDVYHTPGFYLPDFTVDASGRLLIAEQNFGGPGLVIVDSKGGNVAGPIAVGSAPVSIAIVDVKP